MSLLMPESGLVFWMLIVFGIVLFILAKWGFPVITGMVNKRKDYIDRSLANADVANAKLSKLQEESDAIVANADKEQSRILRQAAEERDKIIEDARRQAALAAQKEMDDAKVQIQIQKEEAERSMKREVAVLAVDIAEKIVRKNLSRDEEQMQMIDRMVDEVVKK
ncbi:MAG: F0F1 ATP synthase subunit B [Bacteroidales bacterium]